MMNPKHPRIRLRCLKALYPLVIDKDCQRCDILSELSRFGVSYQTWKQWNYRKGAYDKILSGAEKKKLLQDYQDKKRHQMIFTTMTSIQDFFKSNSYRNKIKYIDMLRDDNYWFWRKHFIEICDEHLYKNGDDDEKETSAQNPRWWKRQLNPAHGFQFSDSSTDSDLLEDDDDNNNNNDAFDDVHVDFENHFHFNQSDFDQQISSSCNEQPMMQDNLNDDDGDNNNDNSNDDDHVMNNNNNNNDNSNVNDSDDNNDEDDDGSSSSVVHDEEKEIELETPF